MTIASQDNTGAFDENAVVSKAELNIDPSGPTPIEDVAPGITSVTDFIPKNAPASHPTPPPDEPLDTSEAQVDIEMTSDDPTDADSSEAPIPLTAESSLVRPREEDDENDEGEPVAKRSKFEGDSSQEDGIDLSLADAAVSAVEVPAKASTELAAEDHVTLEPATGDAEMKSPTLTTTSEVPSDPTNTEAPPDPQPLPPPVTPADNEHVAEQTTDTAAVQPVQLPSTEVPDVATSGASDGMIAEPQAPRAVQPATEPSSRPPRPQYSTTDITPGQLRYLQEKTKNLKKTKNSSMFLYPVDFVTLKIPQYPEIIKQPMDLTTMETKLKSGQYASVQEYADDFYLILNNTRQFNGDAHPVTIAGTNMEAYFRKMMESVPSADQAALPKAPPKKASPKPANHAQRRESRSATQVAPQTVAPAVNSANGAGEAFALQPDGTPQIRRDSTINRPARAIKPPARELTYSKPKRKEHQLELKFCEHVLNEIRSPKYGEMNHVFLTPVDPVAMNIPHYRQVVKHPMDLSTMAQKLKQGQYGKATEFKKDFDLMISNCLAFNPVGNAVRNLGLRFQREFEGLWQTKDKWERGRKGNSLRAMSASGDEDSGGEEDDEEEPVVDEQAIAAIQKQLAEMQSALALMNAAKRKKGKPNSKSSSKKAGSAKTAGKLKPAAKSKAANSKPPKQVTYEEKQEISEAVGRMNMPQIDELTRIITTNCKKYADQEEMELEIDELPNNVQAMLLKYVRSIFGVPSRGVRAPSPDDIAAADDDDFEPERVGRKSGGSGASKRKKHKPMGKKEQLEAIDDIRKQLSHFQGGATSASQSPSSYAVQEETSGDDESEESEEE